MKLSPSLSGESIYVEHLKAKGESFHHTCLIYPSLEAVRKAKDELVNQGREILQSAMAGEDFEFYYLDIPETGSILELLYVADPEAPREDHRITTIGWYTFHFYSISKTQLRPTRRERRLL